VIEYSIVDEPDGALNSKSEAFVAGTGLIVTSESGRVSMMLEVSSVMSSQTFGTDVGTVAVIYVVGIVVGVYVAVVGVYVAVVGVYVAVVGVTVGIVVGGVGIVVYVPGGE